MRSGFSESVFFLEVAFSCSDLLGKRLIGKYYLLEDDFCWNLFLGKWSFGKLVS